MSHADETVTDPHVYRLKAAMSARGAVFAWDYPGATLLRVRITRRPVTPGATPEVVYDGRGGSFRDATARRDGAAVELAGAVGEPGTPAYLVEATLDGETWVAWHDGPV